METKSRSVVRHNVHNYLNLYIPKISFSHIHVATDAEKEHNNLKVNDDININICDQCFVHFLKLTCRPVEEKPLRGMKSTCCCDGKHSELTAVLRDAVF